MSRVRLHIRQGTDAEHIENLKINGPNATFIIATEKIASWNVGHVEHRLLDLLDIAAAVFAADRLVGRGNLSRPGFGERWHRTLSFEIEVREPEFWNGKPVQQALTEAVQFLTDDQVSFAFVKSEDAPSQETYLPIGKADGIANQPLPGEDVHVVLFSGGLDSLAGALEILEQERGKVILVTHRSAPKIIARQDALARQLQQRYRNRVSYLPVKATFKGQEPAERTQRSRSFLFAALGYVIARTAGANRLHFFENGIVSHNLPLSPQIIGTMATRTTHPAALGKFEALLGLIDGHHFTVRNGFEWQTKTEIIRKLQIYDAAEWITETVSCNEVVARSTEHSHCGACSQCLDRRFGILAAGLDPHEPDDHYETPVLTGERTKLRSKTMALDWTLHALRLATMGLDAFRDRFGGDIARVARGFPGLDASEVLQRSFDLHRRHGRHVRTVLEREMVSHAGVLLDGSLPETSLLRMVVASQTSGPVIAEVKRVASELGMLQSPGEPIGDEDDFEGRLMVSMTGEGMDRLLTVRGLGSVRGAPAGPAFALRPQFEADIAEGRLPKDFRHVSAGRVVPEGGPNKQAVAQNVRRCRMELAAFFEAIHDEPPPAPLLIQNHKGFGYRLDPHTILVDRLIEG